MAPTTTTLADDLLLALLDPVSGKPRPAPGLDLGLAGGLLLELALAGGIDVAGPKPAKARVVVVDDTRPHDDLLAGALARIAQRPATAERLVPQLAKGLRPRLLERAEQRGDLRRERLALRRDRWPAADDRRQRELAQRLGDVLLTGVTPTSAPRPWSGCSPRSTRPPRRFRRPTGRPARRWRGARRRSARVTGRPKGCAGQ